MALQVPPRLLHTLGQLSRRSNAKAFAKAARDPMAAQRERLAAALAQGRGTAYGKAHGFDSVTGPADYAAKVPLMTSAELAPWVDRQLGGEGAVLTQEDPVYFVRTSGSTGTPKHVPITDAYREEFQKTVHVALSHLYRRFPRAFRGRALYFVGSRRVDEAPSGAGIGTMSGYNFTEMPPLVRAVYAWPYELFEVADLRTRSFLALWLACLRDVSLVAGIFPAPVVYLLRDLEARAPELADALESGQLPAELELDPEQRAFFSAMLPPRPDVAARLRAAIGGPVAGLATAAMPKLRLVYCWKNATAGVYIPELQRRLGPDVVIRDAIYSACEAWCSIPMGEEEPGGPLAVTSHYFELVPEARAESVEDPKDLTPEDFLTLDQVEDGERYYIVPTTSGGLYRYWLGDVVEVAGFHHRIPRIRFVRKGGAAANLAGEKLTEAHVNEAAAQAFAAHGVDPTYFVVAPLDAPDGGVPGYALHLEGEADVAAVAAAMDQAIRERSFDYDRLRGADQLAALAPRPLIAGTYDAIRGAKVAAGAAEAQLKIAHLQSAPFDG